MFEDLPELPDDLAEAFDCMRLAITRHKHAQWTEIGQRDVRRMLDLLKRLCSEEGPGEPKV